MRLPRRPRLLLPVAIALVAIVALFFLFSGIYTDYLWFDATNYTSVFTGVVLTQIVLFLVGAVLMVGIVGGNMLLAFRVRPMFGPAMFGGGSGADRYRMALDPHRKLIFIVGMGLLALFSGSSFAGQWEIWLKFVNGTSFGKQDKLFGLDISFYMFDLPFIRMVLNFLFTAVIISIVLAAITHYLYGGFRLQSPGVHASRAARTHLSVLLGIFLLLKAVAYWFDRFGLVFSDRGFVHGASYTDVNAVLPAKTILAIIALICAALFFAGVVRPGGMLPGVSAGLLVLSAILIGGVYPALVEQFQVKPNQQGKEAAYIQRNIEATREAYNVDKTEVENYNAESDPAKVQKDGDSSVSGVRLLDPALVSSTYEQTQRIRGFYSFGDTLDVDRYPDSTGKLVDHVVGVRELTGPPEGQNNWINRALVYTHGYGFVAAPGNQVDNSGQPAYDAKDMPVTGPLATSTKLQEPRVYYGEDPASAEYVIAGGNPKNPQELDYPKTGGTGQENTTYTGGGVRVGSFVNRLVYAAKYGEANILLSGDINDNSKILYVRNPRDRVQKVAPFLRLDGNPYPAIVDGRITWIIDGYTTSNDYPYSQSESFGDMTRDTSTDRRVIAQQPTDKINYIRNSVKATVDAYDGTVKLYGWDTNDPMLKTWSKAFPGIILPASKMSPDLRNHVRYPEDLFKVQRYTLSRYHMTDPAAFYNGSDFWNVPGDPTQGDKNIKQPPYYLTTTMPGTGGTPTFSLTTTFVPRQGGANLSAFMAVDSSAGSGYGRLRILRMPSNTPIPGPGQIQNSFQSRLAGQLNVMGVGSSSLRYGNLLTLPYAGGLVYIEPVYVQTTAGGGQEPYPILQRVLVSYGSKIGVGRNLEEALQEVFGGQQQTQPREEQQQTVPSQTNTAINSAIANAKKAYEDAQKALQTSPPNWDAYGEAQKRLEEALKALEGANAQQPKPSATPSATPSASPTATPSATPSGAATPSPSPTGSPTGGTG
ncbi:UPF0182 family protein [Nonomuraea sp. NPDC049400]|uniref:UPF0182 family protein n=1 Tax=Nonomuraea sp. NPDC049400 TaxID=3364352 RepID=UPI0037AA6B3D